jgi:hypothetical protein
MLGKKVPMKSKQQAMPAYPFPVFTPKLPVWHCVQPKQADKRMR